MTGPSPAPPPEDDVFSAHAASWWDPRGPLATLHALQDFRAGYLRREEPQLRGLAALDVGCGGGLMTEELARRGARVTGLDRSEALLAVAREHAAAQGLAVRYLDVPVEALAEREPANYDLVTAFEVIEHVARPEAFVGALARLLKPGGRLYLSTINRTPRAWLLAIVAAEHVLGIVPRGTHRYTDFRRPSEIAAWGRAHGLVAVAIRGVGYNPVSRRAFPTRDTSVNYLLRLDRPARV